MIRTGSVSASSYQDPPAQNMSDNKDELARTLYFSLLSSETQPHAQGADTSRSYLERQLMKTEQLTDDWPTGSASQVLAALPQWIHNSTADTCQHYRRYLAARRAGGPRQLFATRAQALHVLRGLAPTKLVDGSWLYGLLPHWHDPRFTALIRIYLEELGEGEATQNHVLIYRQLLAAHGCDGWQELTGEHFVQGAIQLSLARHARHFLPELIGYNLGYEQLPLHLLITAFELRELNIDPYYFTLHITIDNADSGHAQRALQGLYDALPQVGDTERFMARVRRGYRLNQLGAGTNSIARSFDLDRELSRILADKSLLGRQVHSGHCRIAGRTINAWLAHPEHIDDFIAAMERESWIRRHRAPRHSPFWRLIQGAQPAMFGVFSAYEQQLIHDWIAGEELQCSSPESPRWHDMPSPTAAMPHSRPSPSLSAAMGPGLPDDDLHSELQQWMNRVATDRNPDQVLVEWMSPARHHTVTGLMATRLFTQMLNGCPH